MKVDGETWLGWQDWMQSIKSDLGRTLNGRAIFREFMKVVRESRHPPMGALGQPGNPQKGVGRGDKGPQRAADAQGPANQARKHTAP